MTKPANIRNLLGLPTPTPLKTLADCEQHRIEWGTLAERLVTLKKSYSVLDRALRDCLSTERYQYISGRLWSDYRDEARAVTDHFEVERASE